MQGGHYTAYAKNDVTKQWYTFDDSHVSPMSESNVCTSAAYVVFYKRRGFTWESASVANNNDEATRISAAEGELGNSDDNEAVYGSDDEIRSSVDDVFANQEESE